MEIQFNPSGVPPVGGPERTANRGPAPTNGDNAVFAKTETLPAALQQIPDVRPGVVDRARTLVASLYYPPPDAVDSLARLLAVHLPSQP